MKDRIEAESAQVLLNTNPYAASVTRNQFGELIAVSTSYFNEEKTEGQWHRCRDKYF